MKEIKNAAVLVAVTFNPDTTEGVVPFTVLTLINENGTLELPYCAIGGEGDMKSQLLDAFYDVVEVENHDRFLPDQLRPVGSYSVEQHTSLEITSAFMVFVDGKPSIRKIHGAKTPVWMSIDALEHQPLFGNSNDVIKDVRQKLLEAALTPSGEVPMGEDTKKAVISRYFPKGREDRTPWIKLLQGCGFNIYEYMHPSVAIDMVIFGYKKAEKGRRDELSVLLTERKKDERLLEGEIDPWAGTWSLPGTFLLEKTEKATDGTDYPGLETVREAAVRIVKEKTGIEIKENDELFELKPLVHHSRMGWTLRDGSPVITLPVFIPIEYSEVDSSANTVTTKGCRWYPIHRMLWTDNGDSKVALRGGKSPQKIDINGKLEDIPDCSDDTTTIAMWGIQDAQTLRSPEEVGLHAADAYIKDNQLFIDYYHDISSRPHHPIQDRSYDMDFVKAKKKEGVVLLTADHANIIISALQEISQNPRRTLHIVSRLLEGGTFAPSEIKRMLETWFFPWIFSRSNMQKRLQETMKLITKDESDAGNSERSWAYTFASEKKIDEALLHSKPF